MNPLNNSSENKMKQVLHQHEFEFDSSAWDAMNSKLDQAESATIDIISNKENKEKNKYWIWFIVLIFSVSMGGLFAFYSTNKNNLVSESFKTNKENNLTNNPIPASDLPNQGNNLLEKYSQDQTDQPTKNIANKLSINTSTQSYNEQTSVSDSKLNDNRLNSNDSKIFNSIKLQGKIEDTAISQRSGFNKKTTNPMPETKSGTAATQSSINLPRIPISKVSAYENVQAFNLPTQDANQTQLTKKIAIGVTELLKNYPDEAIQKESKLPDLIKNYSQLQKIKIARPYPWYFSIKAGVNFRTIRNGTVTIEKNIFTSQFGEKGYLFESNLGYRLRPNLMIEAGLTYSSLAYLIQYSYYETPGDLNSWNIETLRQKVNQFNIPLRLQSTIFKTLRANIGGGVSFRSLNKKFNSRYTPPLNGEEIYALAKNNHNPLLSFWEVGLGYDRGPWMLDLKYQRFISHFQKGYIYDGNKVDGNGQEWNFIMTFGYRFQKYQDPSTKVASTVESEYSKYGDIGFNYGIGLATGLDRYRALGSLWESNLEFSEFTSPLKLGFWANYALHPRFSIQAEAWLQSQKVNYEFHAGSSLIPFYTQGNFKVRRLEIPLDLHFRMAKNFKITGGIGLEFNRVKKNPDVINNSFPEFIKTFNAIPDFYKRKNTFWNIGMEYDWDRFSLGLKFRSIFGGKDFLLPIQDNGNSYDFFSTNDQVIFSFNYALQRK